MRIYEVPEYIFDYAFHEVAAVFYTRYPNSFAKHIISEDVLTRVVTEDQIITKKLIVKRGAGFLKSVPKWVSRQTNVQFMPTLEESVFDRKAGKLTTFTRNVSWTNTMEMTEQCDYRPADATRTSVSRTLSVQAHCRFAGLVEQFLLQLFRNSIGKTLRGYNEKLVERFGPRVATNSLHEFTGGMAANSTAGGSRGQQISERVEQMKQQQKKQSSLSA